MMVQIIFLQLLEQVKNLLCSFSVNYSCLFNRDIAVICYTSPSRAEVSFREKRVAENRRAGISVLG